VFVYQLHKVCDEIHSWIRTGQENRKTTQPNNFIIQGQATIFCLGGLVAQLEERRLCKAEALGSNPNKSTNSPSVANFI
jgi:hypothetical protein